MKILSSYCTDKGIKKNTNQDALLIKTAQSSMGDVYLFAICDGMGGLSKGEEASSYLIRRLAEWFESKLPCLLGVENMDNYIYGSLQELIDDSNEKLSGYGKSGNFHLGTTLTAMLIIEDFYYVVHVGDTRLYEIGNDIRQLTQDHTVVANEIKMGRMTVREAEQDARRSVLLQCVGASPKVHPDFLMGRVERNVTYLLCCDGFRHKIEGNELLRGFHPDYMSSEEVMRQQCKNFVELNKQREESDNITVIVLTAHREERLCWK